jgi:hypothetical protein
MTALHRGQNPIPPDSEPVALDGALARLRDPVVLELLRLDMDARDRHAALECMGDEGLGDFPVGLQPGAAALIHARALHAGYLGGFDGSDDHVVLDPICEHRANETGYRSRRHHRGFREHSSHRRASQRKLK